MPEEVNRVVADRVSDLLFAPSEDAAENLRREGYREDQIHLAGNVMVDTLLAARARALARPMLASLGLRPGTYGLVTLHRPENVDHPTVLAGLLAALAELAAALPLYLPAHPRLRAALGGVGSLPGIELLDPLGYLDFVALQAGARVVLTDSGGVQEETTMLGVPCLTLRESTERPVTVTEGTNVVVGRDPDRIRAAFGRALRGEVEIRRPALWDGKAGERIADVIAAERPGRLRPTDLSPETPAPTLRSVRAAKS
jgi:UDP-N-acetylglucosamine 2-epimerase (non-hydrolysing)